MGNQLGPNNEHITSQRITRAWPSLEPVTLADGSGAWRWLYDPDGEGVAVARAAHPSFDTVHPQIQALEALHSRGRKIRERVVTVGVSGHRRFHERPDLVAVEAAVLAEPRWCSFVAFADVTRLSRSLEGVLLFNSFLEENDAELVLLDQGDGAADLAAAHLALLPSLLAAEERAAVVRRMQAGWQRKRGQRD